jgi:hypothetical protein
MKDSQRQWSVYEFVVVRELYALVGANPSQKVIAMVARATGRTDGSIKMRLSQYASQDPVVRAAGRKYLTSQRETMRFFWRMREQDKDYYSLARAALKLYGLATESWSFLYFVEAAAAA